jgi:hypothetical protein
MNLQVIASPDGDIVWVSGPLPGAVHDLTAARIWGIVAELPASGLVVLGDKGYVGETTSARLTGGGTSPLPRRMPTALMPGCAPLVNAPMPSSSPGASSVSSAAAPGAPGSWPRRSTSFRPAKSEDEKGSVSAVNYFFLMNKVYEPRYGKLKAHQIGMSTRIGYIFIFTYFILFFAKRYTVPDTLAAGVFWMGLILAFEWVGSFILRRPAREILEGWHINKGFMWPYVLAAYLLAPLIAGLIFHPGQ